MQGQALTSVPPSATRALALALGALALAVVGCGGGDEEPVMVRFSEVLYHPVLEDDYAERHEFVELHNAGSGEVDLSGFRLVGDTVALELPPGSVMAPGEYRVIAKDRARLAAVWELDPAQLWGDYDGELANGQDTLRLLDPAGAVVDELTYDDDSPWPVAADALGAGADWLDPALLPLERHRFKGYSLERQSFELPTSDPANWALSPLDGSTVGRANAAATATPPAIVLDRERTAGPPGGQDELVATLSPQGAVDAVELEYFVDDIARANEPVQRVAMADRGERRFAASAAAVAEGVVVRYRITADRGAGREVLSPRPTDPFRWHAYAKTPTVASATRTYHLQLASNDWGQLWTNLAGGRDSGCDLNPSWDRDVPAVLLYGDKVYDVRVRYQGSRYNRTLGRDLVSWPYPGPSAGPVRALSWHISFPRYRRLEGKSALLLNKNWQGCPGYDLAVGYRLFRDAGIPAAETRYARLHINGGYYHYMLEIEQPGEDMLAKYGPVGDLFKSEGIDETDGIYGVGDERRLVAACGLTARQRYQLTYDRKTFKGWGTVDPVMQLIEELNDARAAGMAAERAFFAKHFDLERLLDYVAIINWSVPFDDYIHNHYLYRRRDGKWMLLPWDLDRNFGGWRPADSSIYLGRQGEADAIGDRWNVLKDSFLRAYQSEFQARLRQLLDGPLAPAVVQAKVDEWTATTNLAEAQAAPSGMNCAGFTPRANAWKQFAVDRAAAVRARLP